MNRKSILYITIAIGISALAARAAAQNQFRFGVVDTQKVFEEYQRAKAADKVLKSAENRLRGELENLREEIVTMEERLTKQKLFLDDPQTESIENDIRLKKQEYQSELEIGQESIMAKQKELVEPILKEIETVIGEIGESQGYSLVLEKRLVTLYVDSKYDLTEIVLETLDEQYEKSPSSESGENESDKSESPQ